MKMYAGIGSRITPHPVLRRMTVEAERLAVGGWGLRTGGADGADLAFFNGAINGPSGWEVYLPWTRFNGWDPSGCFNQPTQAAYAIAAHFHPLWGRLSPAVQAIHARNVHQVLGADLNAPSRFVLCWTPDGTEHHTSERTGGTGQAIRVAVAYKVPVINMNLDGWADRLAEIEAT